jgi:hypothetical protein
MGAVGGDPILISRVEGDPLPQKLDVVGVEMDLRLLEDQEAPLKTKRQSASEAMA